jgi:hypothetical protein
LQVLAVVLLFGYAWYKYFIKPKPSIEVKFTIDWKAFLDKNVAFYHNLSNNSKTRFESNIVDFLSNIEIIGVETEVTDQDRLLVAASAVITTFGFENWSFTNINEVLLYKDSFNSEFDTNGNYRNILGMVGDGALNKSMVISKPALYHGFSESGEKSNVGIHEFVHLIDKSDGATDGIPEQFMHKELILPWTHLMYEKIQEMKEAKSDINIYGATNEAEFFSVVSEYFFNKPEELKLNHPDLYELLEKMFNQNLG